MSEQIQSFDATTAGPAKAPPLMHPLIVRIGHWINAVLILVMISSGWAIHNADPTLPFVFPQWLTLGGGLIGGLEWHFAAMWFLVGNGAIYITYGLLSGRFRRKLLPLWPQDIIRDLRLALSGKIDHHDITVYNSVQRLLYIGVICLGILAVLSGIAIWKPVQFRPLVMLLGDFDTARLIHFLTMSAITGFVVIHVVMAVLVPRTILAMLRGR